VLTNSTIRYRYFPNRSSTCYLLYLPFLWRICFSSSLRP